MITITGLEETKALLDKVQNLERPLKEACKELCEMAELVVERRYSMYPQSGNVDYMTEIEELPFGYRLTVSGEDVGFLEFGTGIFASPDEFESQVSYDIAPGSWSELHARQFREGHLYWWYGGEKTQGTPPTRGMHVALEEVRNNIDEIVKRKVDEWIHGNSSTTE